MPRRKRDGWERVTMTISCECAKALRHHAVDTREDMGTVADRYLRAAELIPARGKRPSTLLGDSFTAQLCAEMDKTNRECEEQLERIRKGDPLTNHLFGIKPLPGSCDAELLARLQAHMSAKHITQADYLTRAGLTITTAAFRSWRKSPGGIPLEHAAITTQIVDELDAQYQSSSPAAE